MHLLYANIRIAHVCTYVSINLGHSALINSCLKMGPLSIGSWPKRKTAAQRSQIQNSFILHSHLLWGTQTGDISAQHHRLGPYSYRILACTPLPTPLHGQMSTIPPTQIAQLVTFLSDPWLVTSLPDPCLVTLLPDLWLVTF